MTDPGETDPEAEYLDVVERQPRLSTEQQAALGYAIRAGGLEADDARKRLIEANLSLVPPIARRSEGRGLRTVDLIQEANIGLMDAVDRFDPDSESFVDLATRCIQDAIERAVVRRLAPTRIDALRPHVPVPGDPMTADAAERDPPVANQIAETLAALHNIGPASFPPGALLRLDPLPELERLERHTWPWLRTRLSDEQLRRLGARWEDCRNVLPGRERVVCHGDAWFGNMLVSGRRLSALLDWEDACVADPALDLAAQWHLDGDAPTRVIGEYIRLRGPLADLDERIEGYRLIREVAGLAYLLRNGIGEELSDALAKIVSLLD
jgi:RNA polymerase sigma factor (sigma-70 family)